MEFYTSSVTNYRVISLENLKTEKSNKRKNSLLNNNTIFKIYR